MSIENFIPEVWASSILENFHNQAVVTGLTNREYEGQLTSGSKIHIPGIVDVAVKDYKTGVLKDSGGNPIPRTTAPDAVADDRDVLRRGGGPLGEDLDGVRVRPRRRGEVGEVVVLDQQTRGASAGHAVRAQPPEGAALNRDVVAA